MTTLVSGASGFPGDPAAAQAAAAGQRLPRTPEGVA